jgi:hypothetical protein
MDTNLIAVAAGRDSFILPQRIQSGAMPFPLHRFAPHRAQPSERRRHAISLPKGADRSSGATQKISRTEPAIVAFGASSESAF